MKHIKLFEQFVNENLVESVIAEMGIEIPKFKIDLTKNKETLIKLRDVWGKLNTSNGAYTPDSEVTPEERSALEKQFDSLLKTWNTDAKKTCMEFEKVLKSIEFPESAKYQVTFEYVDDADSIDIGWGREWSEIEPKRKLKAFNCFITISYEHTPKGKRKPENVTLKSNWKEIVFGNFEYKIGFRFSSRRVPDVLDSASLETLLQP